MLKKVEIYMSNFSEKKNPFIQLAKQIENEYHDSVVNNIFSRTYIMRQLFLVNNIYNKYQNNLDVVQDIQYIKVLSH